MHILYLPSWYPSYPGDITGVFFREQALALAKHGHQVGVISPQLRPLHAWQTLFTGRRGIEHEIDSGLPTFRAHGMSWFSRLPRANAWLWRRYGLKLFDLYMQRYGKPDLVHVHAMLPAGVIARELYTHYGIPYVVTEHSSGYARGVFNSSHLKIARSIACDAKRKFAVSLAFSQLLNATLGDETGSWEVMPNAVEQRFFERPLIPSENRNDPYRFVTISRLTRGKGVHDLIAAFAKYFSDDSQVTLEIGGDGKERRRLEKLAIELGVSDRVRFLGCLDREQVLTVMASSDAFILASRYETFGVVLIEALALGKPVIATRCGGPESIVTNQNGLLVPVENIDALGKAMLAIRENRKKYNGEAIRASCRKRYSETAIVERLSQVYHDVLQNSRGLKNQ